MQVLEQDGRRLVVIAGRTKMGKERLLEKAAERSTKEATVRLLDAEMVFGMDHIVSAFQKAVRAMANSSNVSDSLATETMLYISGCRQIQEAVELAGLKDSGESIVCLVDESLESSETMIRELNMIEDEKLMSKGACGDLERYGITAAESRTVRPEKQTDLVLERVASVDIRKK